jgi:hypothetical protein
MWVPRSLRDKPSGQDDAHTSVETMPIGSHLAPEPGDAVEGCASDQDGDAPGLQDCHRISDRPNAGQVTSGEANEGDAAASNERRQLLDGRSATELLHRPAIVLQRQLQHAKSEDVLFISDSREHARRARPDRLVGWCRFKIFDDSLDYRSRPVLPGDADPSSVPELTDLILGRLYQVRKDVRPAPRGAQALAANITRAALVTLDQRFDQAAHR